MEYNLIRLECGIKSYGWGKKGSNSAVARFAAATPMSGCVIEQDKPYAELWMGSHPSCPSRDVLTGRPLADLLSENPSPTGPDIRTPDSALPFLFKVLSIDQALSIQAHPNKRLAEQLHRRDPQNYPDDNHKPEIAIAITPFQGLCGFRPLAEIAHFLNTIPPLRYLVGEDSARKLLSAAEDDAGATSTQSKRVVLREAFSTLMKSTAESILNQIPKLVALACSNTQDFAGGGVASTSGKTLSMLVCQLYREFGADVGIFVLFFLNHVTLEPGEAMFLGADNIHAYISGDIVECMAASDNVVRAGLTPKFKDVPTLIDMLTYDSGPACNQRIEAIEYARVTLEKATPKSSVRLYDPPIDEFSVLRTVLDGNGAKATFAPINGPSIIICTSGKGYICAGQNRQEVEEGYVFFIGSGVTHMIESAVGEDKIITFTAFHEPKGSEVASPIEGVNSG